MKLLALKSFLWFNKWKATFQMENLAARRRRLQKASANFEANPNVSIYPFAANGLHCERHVPANAKDTAGVFIYFHGGAYIAGSPQTHRHLCAELAAVSGWDVIAPDYRLAPENPFPAAIEDALNVFDACKQKFPGKKIVLGGDSAGGGLALAAALKLNEENRQANALILLAPWVDLTFSSPVYKKKNFKDPILSADVLRQSAKYYYGQENPINPYISPLFGHLEGLPPVFIQSGSADLLWDESLELERKLKTAGIKVQVDYYKGQIHVFQFFHPILKDGKKAIARIAEFLGGV